MSGVVLLSGGLDSTAALAVLAAKGGQVDALTFDYGQTLAKEVGFAKEQAARFGARWHLVKIDLGSILPGHPLIVRPEVIPLDRSPQEIDAGTPPTYVPFRNGIFLAYAVAFAEARGIRQIWCGGNGLSSGKYWDDTAAFAAAFERAAQIGTDPAFCPRIVFPWASVSKAAAVAAAIGHGADLTRTWSCYFSGRHHCGRCDSCYQRRKALAPFGLDAGAIRVTSVARRWPRLASTWRDAPSELPRQ